MSFGIGRGSGLSSYTPTCTCHFHKSFQPLTLPWDVQVAKFTDQYIMNKLAPKRKQDAFGMGLGVTALCTLSGPAGWFVSFVLAIPAGLLTGTTIYLTGHVTERTRESDGVSN